MENIQKMLELAQTCRLRAYTPYSHFKVGAAILCENGNLFGGCNVENASFPCGTCAEAGAVSAMVAGGQSKIKEILIIADTTIILPCGNCLQKILEFGDENTLIHSANLAGLVKTFKLCDLIPNFFKAGDIKNAQ